MSTLRRFLTATVLAGALVAAAGCSTTVDDSSASEAETRVVTTGKGDVEVPADPQTIVVLNTNLAGYLFELDVPVAATLTESIGGATEPSEFWAEDAAEDGTEILPWSEDGFDFEAILALKPDLILGGGQGFASMLADEAYDRLTEIAPTVLVGQELVGWQEQLGFIARDVLGDDEGADELLAAYDERVAEVKEAITTPELPVGYLITTNDGTPFSVPESAALPQTLAAVGLEPAPVIADNAEFETYGTGDSFELSTEQVGSVLTAPTLIVFPFFEGDGPSVAELEKNKVYAALPAFKNDAVHELPYWIYRADYTRTMAMLDLIEEEFSA